MGTKMKLLIIAVLVCLAIAMCKGVPVVQGTSDGSKPLQCSNKDCSSMKEVRQSLTNFSLWKNSKGWKTGADDCCTWAGVQCESSSDSDSDHDKKDKDPKGHHHHHRHVRSM